MINKMIMQLCNGEKDRFANLRYLTRVVFFCLFLCIVGRGAISIAGSCQTSNILDRCSDGNIFKTIQVGETCSQGIQFTSGSECFDASLTRFTGVVLLSGANNVGISSISFPQIGDRLPSGSVVVGPAIAFDVTGTLEGCTILRFETNRAECTNTLTEIGIMVITVLPSEVISPPTTTPTTTSTTQPTVTTTTLAPTPTPSSTVNIISHLMTGLSSEESIDCSIPEEKVEFLDTDPFAAHWFSYENAASEDFRRSDWLAPDGTLFARSDDNQFTNSSGCVRAALNIAGANAATLPGEWEVQFFINSELSFVDPFTIINTTLSPTPTPTPRQLVETTILAFPTTEEDDFLGGDTAIIPASSKLPALIRLRVENQDTFQGVSGEEVTFEIINSFDSKVIGQLQVGSTSGTQVTATTNSDGWAEAFYFSTPVEDFARETLPVKVRIRATHVNSGRKEVANVKVGLGLELVNVKALDTQINLNPEGSPFAILVEMKSAFFPEIDLEQYTFWAKENVWKDKTIGVQLVTQWLNITTDSVQNDDNYIGTCAFVSKQKQGTANFIEALGSPKFTVGVFPDSTDWPAIVMGSTGTHFYKLKVRGIVLDNTNKRVEWLDETKNNLAMFGLTTFESPSTFELIACSLKPRDAWQFFIIEALKNFPVSAKAVGPIILVSDLLCNIAQDDYLGLALNLGKFAGKQYIASLNKGDKFVTLTAREQNLAAMAERSKGWLKWMDSSLKAGQFLPATTSRFTPRINALSPLPVSIENVDPEIDDIFNNFDAGSAFDHGFMTHFELSDFKTVTLRNIKGLNVFRPDGVAVTLIDPDNFDPNIPLPEYVFAKNDPDGGVALAIIPTSGNYLFNTEPASGGFQMNVTSGEVSGNFDKYKRSEQDSSITWNSQFSILDIDTTGDGFADLNISPDLIRFNNIEVGPEGEENRKSFTFNCEHSMKRGFFFSLETLTMDVGDTANCTLKLTNHESGKTVEISSLLRKGFRSAIKIEPARSVTDENGELEITITAIRKGKDWTAWAVANDNGQFKFNKKTYDTGLAWGMFVEVK